MASCSGSGHGGALVPGGAPPDSAASSEDSLGAKGLGGGGSAEGQRQMQSHI